MQPVVWHGCYEESWKGVIVDEAFKHPAKMSRVLVRRIYDELFRLGALEPGGGSVVVDPFGGIGSTGLEGAYRNCVVICHELEPKFVALAGENFALHEATWSKLGRPRPTILQGDSRKLRESLAKMSILSGRAHQLDDIAIGEIAELIVDKLGVEKVSAILSSPPYAEIASGAGGLNTKPGRDGQQSGRSAASPSQDTDQRYGDAEGQLAKLPKGNVNEFIHERLSPKHDDGIIESGPNHILTRETMSREEFCRRYPELCAAEFEGDVAAIVSSPPYAGNDKRDETKGDRDPRGDKMTGVFRGGYGKTPGQIGALSSGDVSAVVGSPPYVGGGHHPDQTGAWNANGRGQGEDGEHAGYGREDGQIGQMPAGDVSAIVGSPPYAQPYQGGGGINRVGYRADIMDDKVGDRTYQARAGERSAGNLETSDMSGTVADVLVSSHETPNTFWHAAKDIVSECYAVLKPGGYAVWVVKAFVRDKQIQDFPGDWRKLCEHIGFETVQEVHASLVHHYTENTLFDGEIAKKRERKSFFRRLHEKRSPETSIDFEVVWFMRKPL